MIWSSIYQDQDDRDRFYDHLVLHEQKLSEIPQDSPACLQSVKWRAICLLSSMGYFMRRNASPHIVISALIRALISKNKLLIHADGELAKARGVFYVPAASNRPCRDVNRNSHPSAHKLR